MIKQYTDAELNRMVVAGLDKADLLQIALDDVITSAALRNFLRGALSRLEVAYIDLCRSPELCAGKGYCPRDPACND